MTTKTISVKVDSGNSESTVKKLDSAMKQLASGTKLTADEISELTKAAKAVKLGLGDLDAQFKKTNNAMGGAGRQAGQVAVQLEQLFGQINSGGNITQALGFQLADIGIVMGAPLLGAIAGLTASFSGVLLPQVFNTKNELEEFNKQLDIVKATATLSADGTIDFSNSLLTLAGVSKEATRQLLLLTIEQNKIAQSKAGYALKQQFEDLGGFFSNFGAGGALAVDSIRSIGQEAGFTESQIEQLARTTTDLTNIRFDRSNFGAELRQSAQQVIELQTAIAEFEKTPNLTTISKVVDELEGIKVNGEFATDSSRALAQQIFTLFGEVAKGEELTERLNEVLKNGDLSFKKLSGSASQTKEEINQYAEVIQRLNVAQQAFNLNNYEAFKTEQLQAEIAIRRQLAAGEIDQGTANQEIALQNLLFGYEARRNAILENEQFTAEQKSALISTLNDQEVAAQELLEQRLTQTKAKGVEDRKRLEMTQNKQIAYYGQAALAIGSILGKKSEKQRKKWGIAQTVINTAVGIQKAVADYGYPAALPAIAAVAASGIAQIAAINSAGSGSGSISSSAPAAPTPAAQPAQQQQQSSTVEFLGLDGLADSLENSDRLYTGDQMALLVRSLNEAARNGLNTNIGG